jgi:2-oxoglutarate ferredoxin oxidoreductase subunit beta
MGQFKHLMRRNVRMVYIVENNGVYGLTKGQFSATADYGQELKYAGRNEFPPADLCMEAIISGCGFVARSFSGDPKQVRELLKAALAHRGTALLDIISPCVTFNNDDESRKGYTWGKANELPLHDVSFVPKMDEIMVDDYGPGEVRWVEMHDQSRIRLHKLEQDYDPTDRMGALHRLQWAQEQGEFITGLIYFSTERPSLAEVSHVGETAVAALPNEKLQPTREQLQQLMDRLF